MSREKGEYRVGVGASSVLMILVVLALTALSLLALGSARNTEALTRRGQQMVVSYYEAAADAQLRLMAADQWLLTARKSAVDEAGYRQALAETLPEGFALTEEGFAFTLDAGNGRRLAVEARITPLAESGARYVVTRHQSLGTPNDDAPYYDLIGA